MPETGCKQTQPAVKKFILRITAKVPSKVKLMGLQSNAKYKIENKTHFQIGFKCFVSKYIEETTTTT